MMWLWCPVVTILLAHLMGMIYTTLTLWLDQNEYGNFTMIQNMNGLLRIIKEYYNFCIALTKNDVVQILSYIVFF